MLSIHNQLKVNLLKCKNIINKIISIKVIEPVNSSMFVVNLHFATCSLNKFAILESSVCSSNISINLLTDFDWRGKHNSKLIVIIFHSDPRPFSEIHARQLISKISREELEDKYLRLQEDNRAYKANSNYFVIFVDQILRRCKLKYLSNWFQF